MSFREKSAWITLTAILVVSAVYFLIVPASQRAQSFVYCVLAFVAIEIVGHLVVFVRAPRDARTPRDERERLIDLRAVRTAAYVYVVGSFAAVATLHTGASAVEVGNGVLLAFIAAEIVNYTARILYHRRGF